MLQRPVVIVEIQHVMTADGEPAFERGHVIPNVSRIDQRGTLHHRAVGLNDGESRDFTGIVDESGFVINHHNNVAIVEKFRADNLSANTVARYYWPLKRGGHKARNR